MSADWNSRTKYNGRWGSSGFYGDRDDKNHQSSSSSGNSNNLSGYSRYRQSSGGQKASTINDGPNKSQIDDSKQQNSRPYENFSDSYRPYNRNYNTSNNQYPHNSSSTYTNYSRSNQNYPQDNNSSSYYNYRNSGRSRSGSYQPSNNYYNKKANSASGSSSHRPYFERNKSQRWVRSSEGEDEKSFRTNPTETSDHYYPQRDRRASLISSTSSRKAERHNTNDSERSVSPLNSDPYSEPIRPTEGYHRKSRPSLIPSNFKDDEQNDEDEDDYELESAVRESSAQLRSDISSSNGKDNEKKEQSIPKEDSLKNVEENETNDNDDNDEKIVKDVELKVTEVKVQEKEKKVDEQPVVDKLQERITEKLPLTLEHKEEIDNHSPKNESSTRQSTEEPKSEDTKESSTVEQADTSIKDLKTIPVKKEISDPSAEPESKDEQTEKEADELKDSKTKTIIEKLPTDVTKDTEGDVQMEDESDSYEPQDVSSRDVTPQTPIQSIVSTIRNEPEEKSIVKPKIVPTKKVKEKKPISPRQAIDSCIFPMTKVQLRAWELKNHSKEDIVEYSPYLLKKPITNFKDYPFYERNLLVHKQGLKLKMLEKLSVLKGYTFDRKLSLWNEYNNRDEEWHERLTDMDSQIRELYPQEESGAEEQQEQEPKVEQNQGSSTRRGGRYHGDTVRSEAEFLEILKNLEKEKESDPIYKAEALAAKIPDMILNPVQKSLKVVDLNNLVLDKEEWAKRIHTDPVDTFTRTEHEMFCEAFLSFPKRFGRISAAMGGLRTAEECVLHYYKTKKSLTDYKLLLASKKKKKSKGKSKRSSGKSKNATATNTSAPNTPNVDTPNDSGDEKELVLENFIPKEVTTEDVYTETGRRRRAAAPVFDKAAIAEKEKEKEKEKEAKEGEERKRSLENNSAPTADVQQADPNNKAPAKKKPRTGRTKKKEEPLPTPSVPDRNTFMPITSYWSVKDINHFSTLISEFGTNWPIISSKLQTKTVTMCRNYFAKNAEANGWTSIAETANLRNVSYHSQSTSNHPTYPVEVHQQHQELKKPPLGVFSSHGDLPSNVNAATGQAYNLPTSNLPSVKSLTPFPAQSVAFPQSNPTPIVIQPTVPSHDNGMNQHHIQPPSQQPHVANNSNQGVPTSRSNPFSITSLLNPSEDRKPQPPTYPQHQLPPQFPPQMVSTIPKVEDNNSYLPRFPSSGSSTISMLPDSSKSVTSGHGQEASTGSSSVLNILNKEVQSKPNSLSTLVEAAGNESRTPSQPQPPLLQMNHTNGIYTNGPPPPLYGGAYSTPHSADTSRKLDIFNPAPPQSNGPPAPQQNAFKLPSNFNNILSGDPPHR